MKKGTLFFILFLTTHIFFVFFYIHKESRIIKLSYQKQKHEKLIKDLEQQKQDLTQNFLTMQNHLEIKEFAQKKLGMQKINLNKCKMLDNEKTP